MIIRLEAGRCIIDSVNHYVGFGSVETRLGLRVYVLGAPRHFGVPPIRVARDECEDTEQFGTADLVHRLRAIEISDWGNYLSGNYLIVVDDTVAKRCFLITDLGNSYHCYTTSIRDTTGVLFGTDLDRVAQESGNQDVDYVSVVEYATQQSISFPYSHYEGIHEVVDASCTTIDYHGSSLQMQTMRYWKPTVDEPVDSISELAPLLVNGIMQTAETVLSGKQHVGLLLSGGTDSRVLAAILAELGIRATALTISDSDNLEVSIARRVAQACGHTHKLLLRDREYYPNMLPLSVEHEGPHQSVAWHMFLGFRDRIQSYGFDAIIGGYMSDTLLKLHEANVVARRMFGRHLGTLERFDTRGLDVQRGGRVHRQVFAPLFRPELLIRAQQRRDALLSSWEDRRKDGSAWEWSWFWPYSRNRHNANLTTHIFHHPAFELFTDRSFVEVARVASQRVKLNGRLFDAAMRGFLRHTSHIPQANSMIRLSGVPRWNEAKIAALHLLPRRWFFPQTGGENPFSSHRSTTNLRAVWERSPQLVCLREEHGTSELLQAVLRPGVDPFAGGILSKGTRAEQTHAPFSLLYLSIWHHAVRSKKSSYAEIRKN
jgi:asparagine synthetase B (glutamine-hydrolysing)